MSTQADDPVFYALPARLLTDGMSTEDGQDIVSVLQRNSSVSAEVYTPRPDDPAQDEINRSQPETRICEPDATVGLAVFADTTVDGRNGTAASDTHHRIS